MKPLHLQPNEAKTGLVTNNEYTKALLSEWLKKYKNFKLTPVIKDSKNGRRYLEGAIIPAYCHWQYDIDPRQKGMGEARRALFKRDFHYDVVKNRKGLPARIPRSTLGEVKRVTEKYTEWAEQNGAPIPNPDLFKIYRDQYSMDARWDCFHDWLAELGIESDAMPSAEVFKQLET